jgi:predicted permease
MLVQTSMRHREFAIRLALGASRSIVARQLLCESVVLVAAATAAAILMARACLPVVLTLVPQDIPRVDEAAVNARVVIFTTLVGLTTALICWIAPTLNLAGSRLDAVLRNAGRAVASGGLRWPARRLLVTFEIAIAVVLLTFAGLLYRSVSRLGEVDLGFNPHGLLAIDVDMPPGPALSRSDLYQFYDRAIEELSSLPFIESVAAAGGRPLKGPIGLDSSWQIEGQSLEAAENNLWVNTETITPGYFATMQTPLLDGRIFDDRDRATTGPVVIVNEKLGRWAWPGESPIGKRLRVAALDGVRTPAPWWTVIGVVADVRSREIGSAPLDVYVPFRQSPFSVVDLVVRTQAPGATVAGSIRGRVRQINPEGVIRIALMEDEVAAHQAPWKANLVFFGFFAGLTVLLAVVGLYAMVASTVVEQSREIGVRLTLGATARRIVGGVLVDGGRIAVIGAAVGVVVSFLGARLIRALLFEVSPLDPVTLAAAPIILFAVAMMACAIPAFRAARVDPAISLRAE